MTIELEVLDDAELVSFSPEGGSRETSIGEQTTVQPEAPAPEVGQ